MANTPSKKVGPAKAAGTSKKVTASTDKPAPKKAPAKKTTAKTVAKEVDAVIKIAEANPETVKKVAKATAKKAGITVTDAEVEAVLKEAPGIWAKIKGFFGIK